MPRGFITFVADLPYSDRKKLCGNLDLNAKWRDLAGELGYTPKDIYQFGMALHRSAGFNSPSEDLITEYTHKNPTVDELYFKLQKLSLFSVAECIKKFVSQDVVNAPSHNMRDAGEGTDNAGGAHNRDLPRPSQQPIQLHQLPQNIGNALGSHSNGGNFPNQPYVSGNFPNGAQPINAQNRFVADHNISTPKRYNVQSSSPYGANGTAGSAQMAAGGGLFQAAANTYPEHSTNEHDLQYQGQSSCLPNQCGQVPNNLPYTESGYSYNSTTEINFKNVNKATYGFDNRRVISQDRFGVVFRGKLGPGFIAVKRMKKIRDEKTGFDITNHLSKEVDILKRCKHPNILTLLHYIDPVNGQGHAFFIFPFMSKGSLRQNLDSKDDNPMKWEFKLQTLRDACAGLVYLHEEVGSNPYVHGDVSSENILLDDNMVAKLSGFGVAQAATGGSDYTQNTHVSQSFLKNTLFGAMEYLPPEFTNLPELSTKGDIFAFGVVMLETCTGLQALDDRREGGKLLWQYVKQLGENSGEFASSLNDQRQPMPYQTWTKLFNLGKKCIENKKKHRPNSKELLSELETLFQRDASNRLEQCSTQERQVSHSKSWQVDFESFDKQYDVDAANHSIGYALEPNNHTVLKRPYNDDQWSQGDPNYQGNAFHIPPQTGYMPNPVLPETLHQQPKIPIENGPTSRSNSETVEDDQPLNFERPGNTIEFPCFVNDAAKGLGPKMEICVEQSGESYGTGSRMSSKQTSSDYDYARSDMSIITGTHGSTSNQFSVLDSLTDETQEPDDLESDVEDDLEDETFSHDCNVSERSEFRESDLAIFTSPPSLSNRSDLKDFTPSPSVTSSPPPFPKIPNDDEAVFSQGKIVGSLDGDVTSGLYQPLEKLSMNSNPSDDYQALPPMGNETFEMRLNEGSLTPDIILPGQQPDDDRDDDFVTPDFNLVNPCGQHSSDILGDSNVDVNDSVAFFAGCTSGGSTASAQNISSARSTSSQPQITFNYDEDCSVDGVFPGDLDTIRDTPNIDYDKVSLSGGCPGDLNKIAQKADKWF